MKEMMKNRLRYFLSAGMLSTCINLIYLALPVYMMITYDRVLFSFSKATLYTLSIGVLICLFVMAVLDYFKSRMLIMAGNHLVQDMEPHVIRGITENRDYTRGLSDLECIRSAVVDGQAVHLLELPWVLIYLVILYLIHPLVGQAAILAVFLAATAQILLWILEKKNWIVADAACYENNKFITTCMAHNRMLSAMGMVPAIADRYREKQMKIMKLRTSAQAIYSAVGAMARLIHIAGPVAVFTAGAFVFFSHELTAGGIFGGVVISFRLFGPLDRSLGEMAVAIKATAALKRLGKLVDTAVPRKKLSLPAPEGRVELQEVSLALAGKPILRNISLALEPGESLGILGPASSGKSSLCRILAGFRPPSAGKIRLDKAEMSQWPAHELGKYVGYLPQQPALLPGTVAENIARFETADAEKVVAAAKLAGVHEILLKLDQGYDTLIMENADNLSTGLAQMISMARTVYTNPKLVVMDTPQACLDEAGLSILDTFIKRLKAQKTTTAVVIDRPNFLINMDKILVIKEGQAAMLGPAKEVLAKLVPPQQPRQAAGV